MVLVLVLAAIHMHTHMHMHMDIVIVTMVVMAVPACVTMIAAGLRTPALVPDLHAERLLVVGEPLIDPVTRERLLNP